MFAAAPAGPVLTGVVEEGDFVSGAFGDQPRFGAEVPARTTTTGGSGADASDPVERLRRLIEDRKGETVGVLRNWIEDTQGEKA